MLKRALHLWMLCLVGLVVVGCSNTDTVDDPPVPTSIPSGFTDFTRPLFDPANSQIPLPNDLLRVNGRLNFPSSLGATAEAANSLDGFSTSGAIIIPFDGTVLESSVNNDTLPVFNTTTGQRVPMNYSFTVNGTGSVVTASPVFAMEPGTTHVVVLTSGILGASSNSAIQGSSTINLLKGTTPLFANGASTNSALTNEQAAALEPLRAGYQQIWAAVEQLTGTNRANVPFAFAFTTQTLFEALPAARDVVVGANAGFANVQQLAHGQVEADRTPGVPLVPEFIGALPSPLNAVPSADIWEVYSGTVNTPVFRADRATGFWAATPSPTGAQDVPFIATLPQRTEIAPGIPSPVAPVIFQHGITGQKEQGLILANAVNGQGAGLIAIDLELHGSLAAPGVDPRVGFINIANLRNARDNIRQSVVNLYALNNAIVSGQSDLTGNTLPDFAPGADENANGVDPLYVSISLGSIVGDIFTATEENLTASALNVGGARLTNLLLNSEAFSSAIIARLAQNGVQQGTPQFAQFFLIAQAVVDDADPVNYADEAIKGTFRNGKPAQILQQVNVTDAVVPPVAQYDLALQHANGGGSPAFSQVNALNQLPVPQETVGDPPANYPGPGFFEIPNAGHGAILDPSAGPTQLIVTQALTYVLTAAQTGTGQIQVPTGIRVPSQAAQFVEDLDRYRFEY